MMSKISVSLIIHGRDLNFDHISEILDVAHDQKYSTVNRQLSGIKTDIWMHKKITDSIDVSSSIEKMLYNIDKIKLYYHIYRMIIDIAIFYQDEFIGFSISQRACEIVALSECEIDFSVY